MTPSSSTETSASLEQKALKLRADLVDMPVMNDPVNIASVRRSLDNAAIAVEAAAALYLSHDQRRVGDELLRLSAALRETASSKILKREAAIDLRFAQAEVAIESARTLGIPQAQEGITGNRRVRIFIDAAASHWQSAMNQIRQLASGTNDRTEALQHSGSF